MMRLFNKPNERRSKLRFGMQREARYKLLEDDRIVASGSGNTINIGSGGVAFTAEHHLKPGAFIELSISWPVLLDETCPMRLIVYGRVLRSGSRKAVCTIDKYEFRTQARAFLTATAARSDSMLQRWAGGMRRETLKASAASF
jgi:hypothetical protein